MAVVFIISKPSESKNVMVTATKGCIILMEKEELIQALKAIVRKQKDLKDIERDHSYADDLLLDFINDREVTEIFNEIQRWYS